MKLPVPALRPDFASSAETAASEIDELLTVDDVAKLLKVSRSWVYEHTRSRGTPRSERLPHLKLGKYVRFDPRAVRAFLEHKCRLM
jgi:excisionase family DNA binding protein